MSPFSLLPSVALVGFTMVSFLQIGLSECGSSVSVLSFLSFCLLYCIWSLSSISTSREAGFDSLAKLAG